METNGEKRLIRNRMFKMKNLRYDEETKDHILEHLVQIKKLTKRMFDHFDKTPKIQVCWFTEIKKDLA